MLIVSVRAQDITVGPKVGWNITNISNAPSSKNKMSVNVGVFGEFKFNDRFAVQPEVLYSRQGFKSKVDGDNLKIRVNYLNVPILAKIFVFRGLGVELGPQFGFALNTKVKGDDSGVYRLNDAKTFDFSWVFGLTYDLNRLMLSARYNLGLTNVWDKDYFNGDNNKNHVFQLSVGIRFGDLF